MEAGVRNAAEIYRYYRETIKTPDDLRRIVAHFPGFMEIADRNDRVVVVEIWFRVRETS